MSKTLKDYPEILKEWDHEKNGSVNPLSVLSHSNKRYYWRCKKGHSWIAEVTHRVTDHTGCPYCSNRRVLKGYNDLATTNSDLIKEWDFEKNTLISPYEITFGSSKKVWWKCDKGHSWKAVVSSRTSGKRGCPYCSGRSVKPGFNDLKTKCPDVVEYWDYEKNGGLKPSDISPYSKRTVWWKCNKGHSYQMAVVKKTARGFGCPYCSNYRVLKGYNDLATMFPEVAKEWHPIKNGLIKPSDIIPNSTKKIWWKCQMGHEWQATPHDRTGGRTGCPICSARRSTSFPEQAIYFYIKKLCPDTVNRYRDIFDNGMELDIYIPSRHFAIEFDGSLYHRTKEDHEKELLKYKICHANGIKLLRIKEHHQKEWRDTSDDVYFIPKEHNYKSLGRLIQHILNFMDIDAQIAQSLNCSNNTINVFKPVSNIIVDLEKDRLQILSYLGKIKNSLTDLRPDIAEQWDYEKNGYLTPDMFTPGSNESVWWKCTSCGNSYKSIINHKNRSDSRVCPKCANPQRGRSFTLKKVEEVGSLRKNYPELAKEFDLIKNYPLTPDTITAGRFKRAWWKCTKCGYEWQASPNSRKQGIGCPHCSGRVPMPGLDDLLTINPNLCKEWNYEKIQSNLMKFFRAVVKKFGGNAQNVATNGKKLLIKEKKEKVAQTVLELKEGEHHFLGKSLNLSSRFCIELWFW